MILSAQSIRKFVKIEPFDERTVHPETGMSYGLSGAGYDITVDQDITLTSVSGWSLASAQQRISLDNTTLGVVHDKSSLARQGLALQNTVIEPGWCGFLTLELSYHGEGVLKIARGQPIAQIVFQRLDQPTEQPYDGKYQNQPAMPVEYIREKAE